MRAARSPDEVRDELARRLAEMGYPRPRPPDVDEHRGDELADELAEILERNVPPARLVGELRRIRAQGDLVRWALAAGRRDELVAAAAAAGVNTTQISRLTGLARTTVDRIVGTR